MKRLVLALGLALALSGCAEDSVEPETCACAGAEPVVDPALMAFLSKAKSAHELADILVEDGKIEEALLALDRLSTGPLPASSPPEVREVLADTLARTADLRSEIGQLEAAGRDLDRGLELARERSLFRGRLMEVRGVVEQRRHDKLLEEGDEDGAKAAKNRAIEAFQEAVAIQDEVIQKTLGEPPSP